MKKSNKFLIVFSAAAITFGSLFAFAPASFNRHGRHCGNNNFSAYHGEVVRYCNNNVDFGPHNKVIMPISDSTKK